MRRGGVTFSATNALGYFSIKIPRLQRTSREERRKPTLARHWRMAHASQWHGHRNLKHRGRMLYWAGREPPWHAHVLQNSRRNSKQRWWLRDSKWGYLLCNQDIPPEPLHSKCSPTNLFFFLLYFCFTVIAEKKNINIAATKPGDSLSLPLF